jgi:hypothetical protein
MPTPPKPKPPEPELIVPYDIQVHEEHAGPLPEPSLRSVSSALRYNYVAYSDAEDDAGLYGYGHTPSEAIADFCRNCAEAYCNGCTEDECPTPSDCILTSGALSTLTKARI